MPGVSADGEPTEIEIKLAVSRPSVIRRLLNQPQPHLLAGFEGTAPPHQVRVTDRYLDTSPANGELARAGIRARLRRRGDEVKLTVKRPSTERRGVSTRVELEGPATRSLDPARWPASDARTALERGLNGQPLQEIARLRQRRLTQILRQDGTAVEISLDALEAMDGGQVLARRHELEAELKEGAEAALALLGDALLEIDGVEPPLGSKLAFALEARALARSGS